MKNGCIGMIEVVERQRVVVKIGQEGLLKRKIKGAKVTFSCFF